ncbi:MAG: hypothetical protein ACLFNP_00300 [Spirochaetaceae bacterium]
MKLYIFHYHLQPGGVTGVIKSSVLAAREEISDLQEIVLVTGDLSHTDELLRELGGGVRLLYMPEIGYLSLSQLSEPSGTSLPEQRASAEEKKRIRKAEAQRLAGRIRSRLLGECEPGTAVWWVHNYHLGKNPVFTDTLLRLAEEREDVRLLLQIHDFPEDARYAGLRYLNLLLSGSAYPIGRNIRYAAINSRDLRLLREAGLPEELSFLLPNPIGRAAPERSAGKTEPAQVRERLNRAFSRNFPLFDPEFPIALYPVRTIRRKNVMEAALLVHSLSLPVNLVVTLPGVSQQEKNYSAMVEHSYNEGIIRGLWGIGTELDAAGVRFEELQGAADVFVSSSVQEGFGFQYVDSLRWGKPLIARDLAVLDDVRPLLPGAHFYKCVSVPTSTPSLSDIRPMLKMHYQERLDRLEQTLPEGLLRRLQGEVAELLSRDTVDFSFLMPQMQYTYVKDLRDDAFRADVAALNPETLEALKAGLEERDGRDSADALREVERRFGFRAYGERLRRILDSFGRGGDRQGPPGERVQESLLEEFATIDQLRLLFG